MSSQVFALSLLLGLGSMVGAPCPARAGMEADPSIIGFQNVSLEDQVFVSFEDETELELEIEESCGEQQKRKVRLEADYFVIIKGAAEKSSQPGAEIAARKQYDEKLKKEKEECEKEKGRLFVKTPGNPQDLNDRNRGRMICKSRPIAWGLGTWWDCSVTENFGCYRRVEEGACE